MKIAVERQSGPFMMALTTLPIQLSPAFMDSELCWVLVFRPMTYDTFGRVPLAASVSMLWDVEVVCWADTAPVVGFFHLAVAPESQPQPLLANAAWDGLTPWKPSSCAATRSRCEPQLADTFDSNVRSATRYCSAYIARFGIWVSRY